MCVAMKKILIVIGFLFFSFALACAQMRDFKDKQGRTISAQLVFSVGDDVTIKMADGQTFQLKLDVFSEEDQKFIKEWANKNQTTVGFRELNEAFGLPLFLDVPLWEEDARTVSQRLKNWQKTTKGSGLSCYRNSSPADSLMVLGAHPYSLALFGGYDGKVTDISIVFANRSECVYDNVDVDVKSSSGKKNVDNETEKKLRIRLSQVLKPLMDADEKAIKETLSAWGNGKQVNLGKTRNDKERVTMWKVNDFMILLVVQDNAYVGIRIVKQDFTELRTLDKTVAEAKTHFSEQIEKADNGDVILTGVPAISTTINSVIPAAFESFFRYGGLAADSYALSMIGLYTDFANPSLIANDLITNIEAWGTTQGLGFSKKRFVITVKDVQQYIDKGQPILWVYTNSSVLSSILRNRNTARSSTSDTAEWIETLNADTQSISKLKVEKGLVSATLIIGYNKETDEIGFYDSLGKNVVWLRTNEANAVSENQFFVFN